MPGLSAWQGLIVHGRLQPVSGSVSQARTGGVGYIAAQLVPRRGATLVEAGAPCDLLLDTAGGGALARRRRPGWPHRDDRRRGPRRPLFRRRNNA
jgi:hypothetical protein